MSKKGEEFLKGLLDSCNFIFNFFVHIYINKYINRYIFVSPKAM